MKTHLLLSLFHFIFVVVICLPLQAENEPLSESSETNKEQIQIADSSERLLSLQLLDKNQLETEYLALSRQLRDTFRDFIHEHPPMSPDESEALRADFIELNLELFVEQKILRKHVVYQSRDIHHPVVEIRPADVQKVRQEILTNVGKMRAEPVKQ